jgi:hypothetical protein
MGGVARTRKRTSSATYQGFVEGVKQFYVGEYWIKRFEVRLGEEPGR